MYIYFRVIAKPRHGNLVMLAGSGLHGTTITAGYHNGRIFKEPRLMNLKIGPSFPDSIRAGHHMRLALESAVAEPGEWRSFTVSGQSVQVISHSDRTPERWATLRFNRSLNDQLDLTQNETFELIEIVRGAVDPTTDIE